ncbi:MAG: hypothetical protein QM729_06995 [Solirubrobacterales bacterium]
MAERLRALLEHPLDPRVARAIVLLACAATLGLAIVVALARPAVEHPGADGNISSSRKSAGSSTPSEAMPAPRRAGGAPVRQDPQDRPGTAAHRRAAREIASHRALQHVPWRAGGVAIDLVGARAGRAVLAVRAASLGAAHRGWHTFLRRFDDAGAAYLPRFEVVGGARG